MDILKIVNEISEHEDELTKAGISVVMAVAYEDNKMCLCATGNLHDQIRGLAGNYIEIKNAAVKMTSKETFKKEWRRALFSQTINLALNKKMKEKSDE